MGRPQQAIGASDVNVRRHTVTIILGALIACLGATCESHDRAILVGIGAGLAVVGVVML